MIAEKLSKLFQSAVEVVFGIILLFLVIGILIGAMQLVLQVGSLLSFQGVTGYYIDLITDVLTLYILVELSRSLVEYFHSKKLKLTLIVDAAIVFVIREVLIGIFKEALTAEMIYAMGVLILILGLVRTASIVFHDQQQTVMEDQQE